MEKYIGVKIVKAVPAKLGEALAGGIIIKHDGNEAADGYVVEYPGGYRSWCPKEQFEEANRRIDAMTFGHAIEAMKQGKKVARAGWNGKGMHISYCDPYNNKQFDLVEKEIEGTFAPYIGMKTVDNKYVPWLASQTDMLAEDWQIIE